MERTCRNCQRVFNVTKRIGRPPNYCSTACARKVWGATAKARAPYNRYTCTCLACRIVFHRDKPQETCSSRCGRELRRTREGCKGERITFNGVHFYKYAGRKYCTPGVADATRGIEALHREIWKFHNGPIPTGYELHHRDGDTHNNAIGNLECCSTRTHKKHHPNWVGKTIARDEHLARIRPLAAAWHSTKEGRALHRANGKLVAAQRPTREGHCEECKQSFVYRDYRAKHFCSSKCYAKNRNAKVGAPYTITCSICRRTVQAWKSTQRTCSRVCGGKLRRSSHSSLQPDRGRRT